MDKNTAYEYWLSSDPIERTSHSGFMAGWAAAFNFMALTMQQEVLKQLEMSKNVQ